MPSAKEDQVCKQSDLARIAGLFHLANHESSAGPGPRGNIVLGMTSKAFRRSSLTCAQ